MLEPPYETNGSVIPVSGTMRRTPPTMMKVCSAKPKLEPGGKQLREAVVRDQRDAHPARDEREVAEEHRGSADQPELLGDRRVDEVGLQIRDQLVPSTVSNVPLPIPVPPYPPFAIE